MEKDYSEIKWKLLCFSNLSGNVKKQAENEWKHFFREPDAIWMDLTEGDSVSSIGQKLHNHICNADFSFQNGQPVIPVFLLDLSQELEEAKKEQICTWLAVPEMLTEVFQYRVNLAPVFGWMGQIAFADKAPLRENVKSIVQIHRKKKDSRRLLCLTGESLGRNLSNDHAWKAVMLFIELIRRMGAPEDEIPLDQQKTDSLTEELQRVGNDNFGFLRYGEYNKKELDQLRKKQSEIEGLLSDQGAQALENRLNVEREEIDKAAKSRFPVSAACQPLHPDLFVKGWFKRCLAKHGHNKRFEAARKATLDALVKTRERLEEDIEGISLERLGNPDMRLERLLEDAKVGLCLERNEEMMRTLLFQAKENQVPREPGLSLNGKEFEEEIGKEIGKYLSDAHAYASNLAIRKYEEALFKAYQRRTEEKRRQREHDLKKEMIQVQGEIKGLLSVMQDLHAAIQDNGNMPESCFSSSCPGGKYYRMAIVSDQDGAQPINPAVSSFYLDKENTYDDGAPLKGLQLFLSICDDGRLEDIIG